MAQTSDIIKTRQDLRHLVWNEKAVPSGTAGSFLKAREGEGPSARYYKLSCYDSYRGVYGHECVNELVASRLMKILGVNHLRYRLIKALIDIDGVEYETWLNESKNFRKPKERELADRSRGRDVL